MAHVFLVDDESDLLDLLRFTLSKDGHEVDTADNGLAALEFLRKHSPDLIVLDRMMPHMDGLEVVKQVRATPAWNRIPVLMLTARGSVDDRVDGLEAGADDYLAKPFSNKELLLRVRALLRRVGDSDQVLVHGPFRLERESLRVHIGGNRIDLTATEFKLLHMLMQDPGVIQSRDTLLREVWGYKDTTLTRTLDTHVKRLREKLLDYAPLLETVRGVGYRLNSSL